MEVHGVTRRQLLGSPLAAGLSGTEAWGQDDVVETFRRAKLQTMDFASHTIHLVEINSPESRFDGVTVLWMKIPHDGVALSTEVIGRLGSANEIYRRASTGDEVVVLSAGFHDGNNEPVGLCVNRGRVISNLQPWTAGGILFQNRQTYGIIPVRQWTMDPSELECAVQAKPLVVESGRNGILSDDGVVSDRVGIGFTRQGELLVCGAFRKRGNRALSLFDFGRLMATSALAGGPAARTVLNLEGGPGAHLYFPSLRLHFGTSGSDFVMNSIHVRRKK